MIDQDFEAALSKEIAASEQLRVTVLAALLGVLLVVDQTVFLLRLDLLQQFSARPLHSWIPLAVIGPFALYETVVALAIRWRRRRDRPLPRIVRFLNAIVEMTLPTIITAMIDRYMGPEVAFGAWPSMLYLVFIVAATLRLDFTLPAFTGAVGAAEYIVLVLLTVPLSNAAIDPAATPMFHFSKAAMILIGGILAGLVAVRLRSKFRLAFTEAMARERVTNVFGQHVSPAVVDRLLSTGAEYEGETREVCVMFLDIRNFTAAARQRGAADVVEFLNQAFGFMIEAVGRHGGFINKFLGDGFMAVFGAPFDDPAAAAHAVAAARDILAEIDARGHALDGWPLRVGIGIHTGIAVVGNVGSAQRKEFTVIGDTVNLASRIEQLNKEAGSRLLVSDAVASRLGVSLGTAQPLPDVTVKGYDTAIRVWRLD